VEIIRKQRGARLKNNNSGSNNSNNNNNNNNDKQFSIFEKNVESGLHFPQSI